MGKRVSILSRLLGQNLKNEASYDYNLVLNDNDMFRNELARLTEKLSNLRQKIDVMDIYAHGMFVPKPDVIYAILDSQLVGAYGVKMGYDYLTSRNVDMMNILSGHFSNFGVINFHVCSLASEKADWTGKKGVYSGNGVALCKSISKRADCLVRASTSLQRYTYSSDLLSNIIDFVSGNESTNYDLEFLEWSPPTFLFDPNGNAVKEQKT